MQDVIDKELHTYFSKILNLLHKEKLAFINIIDSFIATATNITTMKKSSNYNQKNIKNQK